VVVQTLCGCSISSNIGSCALRSLVALVPEVVDGEQVERLDREPVAARRRWRAGTIDSWIGLTNRRREGCARAELAEPSIHERNAVGDAPVATRELRACPVRVAAQPSASM
jgi:hypothetical protein